MLLNCGVGKDSWESLGLQEDSTSPSLRKSALSVHWKDRCWSWNPDTWATWCKELTHLKRPWCWERLRGEGKGDDRGWDCWMASLTQGTWVWVGDGQGGLACCSPWGHKKSDMTEGLNWTELKECVVWYNIISLWFDFPNNQWYWLSSQFPINSL